MTTVETSETRTAFREAGVRFAYLFGSRAREEARAGSDVDIAVMLSRPLDLGERMKLVARLAEALDVADVDLVVLDEADLELRGKVVQEGRPIFSDDEPARVAFEVRTRSEYFDFLPTLQEHTRRYIRQVAEHGLSGGRS